MQSGISTACLYPMLLEKSFSTLIAMGFRTYEVFLNTCSEMQEDYIGRLRKMADDSGSTVKSVHPFTSGYENFLLFSDYKRRFEDGLKFYRRYFRACNLLGADILVLHGRRSDKKSISDEEFFERYLRLFELGGEYGVTVAQENVNLYCSNSSGFIRKMRRTCGERCAFVFDVKQAVRGGTDPFELCAAMGERLCHVHINDNSKTSDCLLPGSGTMDYAGLLGLLKRFGFDGCLMIEVYRKSFGSLDELISAKRVVDNLL